MSFRFYPLLVFNTITGVLVCLFFFFFFKQKTAYEMLRSLVGSEMCIRDRDMSDDEVDVEKTKALAEAQKAKGNAAFAKGDNKTALRHYTMAINLAPENAVYYSNRSAAHAGMGSWSLCLEDSHKTIELRPCLLYTSDAADEEDSGDLGGRRIIKKRQR
eukprot:TRINITY_DN1885_c0_g1_i2.p1 TRINITY_DN1885_c0_g1~~TRINITY_DN1885_c0_g1_i2.p1  ORF type:complete len:159 (-),score=49.39 TRINITY_DN1885_c0_g1_i2:50-526(-)